MTTVKEKIEPYEGDITYGNVFMTREHGITQIGMPLVNDWLIPNEYVYVRIAGNPKWVVSSYSHLRRAIMYKIGG